MATPEPNCMGIYIYSLRLELSLTEHPGSPCQALRYGQIFIYLFIYGIYLYWVGQLQKSFILPWRPVDKICI